jgi:hypothetical protein
MAAGTLNACGSAYPYWIAHLGELSEPACRRYATLCSAAVERCDLINPLKNPVNVKKPGIKSTSVWPGTNRGWGPITMKLDEE